MRKGFTLIELLVVVMIIGILGAIVLPQYQAAVLKSRFSELVTVSRSLWDAQERHYLATGEYAKSFSDLDIELSGDFYNSSGSPSSTLVTPKKLSYYLYNGFVAGTIQGLMGVTYYYDRQGTHTDKVRCYAVVDNEGANKMCRANSVAVLFENAGCNIGAGKNCNIYKMW